MPNNQMKQKLLFGLILFSATASSQQVYSWVDKNGVRHFSDVPTDQRAEVVEGIESTPTVQKVVVKTNNRIHGFEDEPEEHIPGSEVIIKGTGARLSCNKLIAYKGNIFQGITRSKFHDSDTPKRKALVGLRMHENTKEKLKKENQRLQTHLEKQQEYYKKNESIKYAIDNSLDQIAENKCEIQVHLRYMELIQKKINSL
ncbi:DUF4124 domain-containing protein [Pseudoalteromonas sp. SA25]|uniref:DUF4124 domain-containing protein n=1 Tax=Pseudoalteromonas sp. SA25 TaxID=2686347 RepID=UPI0013FDF848|nr:DUF4124 domain-containing protein [Pseudoalteromonas sp. SA25]